MSTLDVVNQVGGSAANFLDIGGGANADVMAAALEVINADPAVRSIFINIFGGHHPGATRWPTGSSRPSAGSTSRSPIVIRLDGTNAEEGRAHAGPAPVRPADQAEPTMLDAARRAVALAAAPADADRRRTEREHLRRRDDHGRHPGHQPDQPGPVPRAAQPGLRHQGGGRHQPGKRGARTSRASPSSPPWPRRWPPPGPRPRSSRCRRRTPPPPSWRRPAAGIAFVVCITEGIPAQDEALTYNRLVERVPRHPAARARTARASSARASATSASPRATSPWPAGPVGIVSRSGTLTYQALYELSQQGVGPDHLRRASAATRCRAPTSSTAWRPSRPTPTPRPS